MNTLSAMQKKLLEECLLHQIPRREGRWGERRTCVAKVGVVTHQEKVSQDRLPTCDMPKIAYMWCVRNSLHMICQKYDIKMKFNEGWWEVLKSDRLVNLVTLMHWEKVSQQNSVCVTSFIQKLPLFEISWKRCTKKKCPKIGKVWHVEKQHLCDYIHVTLASNTFLDGFKWDADC